MFILGSIFIVIAMLFLFLSIILLLIEIINKVMNDNNNLKYKLIISTFLIYVILIVIGLVFINI